jgi:ELWxxDGT repeat protein
VGSSLYFTTQTAATGRELWRIAADGTISLTDLNPGPEDSVYALSGFALIVTPDVAPVISSNGAGASALVSLAENGTAVTTVTATDDTPGVHFALTGADADRFSITASGALTFQSAPDFEKPADAGGNNVYDVSLTAIDADGLSDTQALSITITDVKGITYNGGAGSKSKTGTPEADTLNGKGGNDTLKGGGGKDTIDGGTGNDKLFGGDGNDKLTGGTGKDLFVFNAALALAGIDKIIDFSHADDTIRLEDSVFTALGVIVASNEFVARASGHSATKASHHLIYDKSNGSLWYDADGKASGAAVKIAQLGTATSHPMNVAYDDFAIV